MDPPSGNTETPGTQAPFNQPSPGQPLALGSLLEHVKAAWEQHRGPTTPPLQLLGLADTGELLIAEGSNLQPLLLDQLNRQLTPNQAMQGQLLLHSELQHNNGSRQLVFTLMGPPDIELLRLTLPA